MTKKEQEMFLHTFNRLADSFAILADAIKYHADVVGYKADDLNPADDDGKQIVKPEITMQPDIEQQIYVGEEKTKEENLADMPKIDDAEQQIKEHYQEKNQEEEDKLKSFLKKAMLVDQGGVLKILAKYSGPSYELGKVKYTSYNQLKNDVDDLLKEIKQGDK